MSAVSASSGATVMATLKDGTQVPELILTTTMKGLRDVKKIGSYALFDLVEKCIDPNYPFGNSKSMLKKYALIDGEERVPDMVKSIVLNAVKGEGLSMKLVDPRQKV